MSFYGFDVYASDSVERHFLFATAAKECARTLVNEKRVAWATVSDCEGGSLILECGDPNATEGPTCSNDLKTFCNALAELTDVHEHLKLLEIQDATAGTCYVRFGSTPRISGSRKLKERVDTILRLASGSLDDWGKGKVSVQTVCRSAQVSGSLGLAPYAA
jgi:hypothetical protein